MQRQENLKTRKRYPKKAFALRLADDSQGVGLCTGDDALVDAGALLSCLEDAIELFAETGNREGLREALYKYVNLWIALVRGCPSCE